MSGGQVRTLFPQCNTPGVLPVDIDSDTVKGLESLNTLAQSAQYLVNIEFFVLSQSMHVLPTLRILFEVDQCVCV